MKRILFLALVTCITGQTHAMSWTDPKDMSKIESITKCETEHVKTYVANLPHGDTIVANYFLKGPFKNKFDCTIFQTLEKGSPSTWEPLSAPEKYYYRFQAMHEAQNKKDNAEEKSSKS